eukprot:359804-Chlamydomonas_euryale.AAC.5
MPAVDRRGCRLRYWQALCCWIVDWTARKAGAQQPNREPLGVTSQKPQTLQGERKPASSAALGRMLRAHPVT